MKHLVFLLLALAGPLAVALEFPKESRTSCKKEANGPYLQKELNLTKQQREQVKALHDSLATLVETRTKTVKGLNEDLIALLQTPGKGPEVRAALMEKFQKYQTAKNQLYLTRFEMALNTRELLTDDQIKKYKAFYHIKSKDEPDSDETRKQ